MNKLDINTFGETPASHYLVRRLNELDNKSLTRACTVRVNTANQVLKELIQSDMSAKSVANIARLMREEATQIKLDSKYPDADFVAQLLRNVIIGKIKQVMRKASVIRKIEHDAVSVKRVTERCTQLFGSHFASNGVNSAIRIIPKSFTNFLDMKPDRLETMVTASLNDVVDIVTPELLQKRSYIRCTRQGKAHTK